MMSINEVQLRDLVVALIVLWGVVAFVVSPIALWTLNRIATRSDVREVEVNEFMKISNKTLAALNTITQIHEHRHNEHDTKIGKLEETLNSTFMVKYTKNKS